ncbi:MAG TPA: hypothetical protein VIZ68_05820 [Thermoplasmata archaeon]
MRPRPPRLYRLSRAFNRAGTIALVLILLFVGVAAYSASQLRPHIDTSSTSSGFSLAANGSVHLTTSLNLSNPGYFSIAPITVQLQLRYPDGSLLALGGSPTVAVDPGGTGVVPISLWIPLSSATASLLTNDQNLTTNIWANLTYASVFQLRLDALQNLSWGAPFEAFNATLGTPAPQSNGTVLVPVTITFRNDASFDVVGTLTVELDNSAGTSCSTSTVAIDAPKGTQYDQTDSVFLSGSCNPSGGSLLISYQGNGISYTFPREAIP